MARTLAVNDSISIAGRELRISHARSAGPGGQNVNKVNTKAVLRWSVVESPSLPDDVRRRFLTKYVNRINAEGELVLSSDVHREQARNQAACLDKLRAMILAVAKPPVRRKKTKPTRASNDRRLQAKREAAAKKRSRRGKDFDRASE
jgi:ribosome-associated protein